MEKRKTGKLKGQKKQNSENRDEAEKNPLLKIDDNEEFSIESSNLLQKPGKIIFSGYETFDLSKEKNHFDMSRLNENSVIIIVLRYYEYICIAKFKFSFIIPILQSDINPRETFDLIKHALRNRLLLNAPSFDTIFEPDFHYIGKIKY